MVTSGTPTSALHQRRSNWLFVGHMDQIQSLIARVDQRDNLGDIRLEIIDVITHYLEQNKASLGYWELTHLTNALGSLSMNISASRQPTYGGLRLCLFDVEKAITAHTVERSEYDATRRMATPISPDMLMQTLMSLLARVTARDTDTV